MMDTLSYKPESAPAGFSGPKVGDKKDKDKKSARGIMSINDYVAGGIAGSCGIIVGHPFDTAKVQMQIRTTGDHKIESTYEALKSISAQGLKRGMYRGMFFPVMSYACVNSVFFGVYGNVIKLFEPDDQVRPTNTQVFYAGCVAGTAQLSLACPTEVIKCTLQSQIPLTKLNSDPSNLMHKPIIPKDYYHGPFQCIYGVYKKDGIRGFYKGTVAMFVRDVPSYGLYLLVYEYMFALMLAKNLTDSQEILPAIVAGGLAGCASWFCIMPFDVIKSRMQVDHGNRYKGLMDCLIKTVKNAGVPVLFRGTVLTMIRAFPVNAVTFLLYSQLLKLFESVNPR